MMMSKSDFDNIKFDEGFLECGEDVALCYRVAANLKKYSIYNAEATGVHFENATRKHYSITYTPDHDLKRLEALDWSRVPNFDDTSPVRC